MPSKTFMAALALKARLENRSANTLCRVVGLMSQSKKLLFDAPPIH